MAVKCKSLLRKQQQRQQKQMVTHISRNIKQKATRNQINKRFLKNKIKCRKKWKILRLLQVCHGENQKYFWMFWK